MRSFRRLFATRSVSTNWIWFLFTLGMCSIIVIVRSRQLNPSAFQFQLPKFLSKTRLSPVDIYQHADNLKVGDFTFQPCTWANGRKIQYCAGHCPWVPKKLVKCDFIPRIINKAFYDLGMYCIPPADSCPSYNAYLKDTLPNTRELIKTVPDGLLSNFTLGGLIPVLYNAGHDFINNSAPLVWSQEYVDSFRKQVKLREPFGTYKTSDLYPVLDTYGKIAVESKKCAVIGTIYPWIEAALLEYGAASVLTVEYAKINTQVPRLSTITPFEFAANQEKLANEGKYDTFDSIWSYSSLEHDGLGRFTDPINPDGDMQTMVKISCMLKPGGLLFLAIPTNQKDSIFFNLHRVYGPVRLPIILRYFHLVQAFIMDVTNHPEQHNQPILVLQNKVGCR